MFQSILDNDLYKFTMQQAVCLLYPDTRVEYTFFNRGRTHFYPGFARELQTIVKDMGKLHLTPAEEEFLKKQRFLTPGYIWYLKNYCYDTSEVDIHQNDGDLVVKVRGPWHKTILWEVPLMAAISELWCRQDTKYNFDDSFSNAIGKAKTFRDNRVKFADFGTRRRFAYEHHKRLLAGILTVNNHTLVGTSNVHLAMQFGLRPIGTQAHEWYMFHGADCFDANLRGMENWVKVYGADLGIALTDTYTTEYFLKDFDKTYANLFSGVRHDSGDPFEFTDKIVNHYKHWHSPIDPQSKVIVFSDSLTPEKAIAISEYCKGKIQCSFGIGTNLTNDIGIKPLNIVIKMTKRRIGDHWRPTIKLSDDVGKHTGDQEEIDHWLKVVRRV